MDYDCGFTKENKWFRYRAAAIIVEDGCVLFATNEKVDYYYSIGGAVHIGERAEDAVKREVFEETGVEYEVERLAVIHENFFKGLTALDGLLCHEVALYYLMKPKGQVKLNCKSTTMGVKERICRIPIDKLSEYKTYPVFLKKYLFTTHNGIEHIITCEGDHGIETFWKKE